MADPRLSGVPPLLLKRVSGAGPGTRPASGPASRRALWFVNAQPCPGTDGGHDRDAPNPCMNDIVEALRHPAALLAPCILLLLAEQPDHGYALVDRLKDFGLPEAQHDVALPRASVPGSSARTPAGPGPGSATPPSRNRGRRRGRPRVHHVRVPLPAVPSAGATGTIRSSTSSRERSRRRRPTMWSRTSRPASAFRDLRRQHAPQRGVQRGAPGIDTVATQTGGSFNQ